MIRLQRIWFDLTHPQQEWYWLYYIKRTLWKVKDYDRLEHDYCCVLDHATNSRMSKPNYELNTIYSEIDDSQMQNYYGVVRDDINMLIEKGADITEIKEYINNL
jgi:hypothetical protein